MDPDPYVVRDEYYGTVPEVVDWIRDDLTDELREMLGSREAMTLMAGMVPTTVLYSETRRRLRDCDDPEAQLAAEILGRIVEDRERSRG